MGITWQPAGSCRIEIKPEPIPAVITLNVHSAQIGIGLGIIAHGLLALFDIMIIRIRYDETVNHHIFIYERHALIHHLAQLGKTDDMLCLHRILRYKEKDTYENAIFHLTTCCT